jgi:DUF917 family protein
MRLFCQKRDKYEYIKVIPLQEAVLELVNTDKIKIIKSDDTTDDFFVILACMVGVQLLRYIKKLPSTSDNA